ncbi:uncharacterized protein TRIADDRAFT_55989 [Trichoplax adhaerens]|uniref:G-protein coupled receptors family 2 profile 2 domain-containing protein n=1 Tax=Trichoplax adhaerens TaxID=10228 RepID=B3RTN6_TRIAD|nr:hypothetical protein TRIADDRAFT_55989 [Trichoplax adhaerens]EDV26161.1 hypothetical protein TRIADDRAFT_55989 [Trichoplax adhaerens]|eukprot:XP_002112194.1 hypothetical protein TRIADDRAFT_55989 [Trichoplax adhaerens]
MPKLNNSNPFTFTLFHNKVNFTTTFQPVCVFWEFATNSKSSGNWSDSGCSVVHWNQTHTHCRCNHLTHFAILMRVTEVEISQEHLVNLDTITFICSDDFINQFVSTSSEHHEIHINLALAMLLSQIGIILTGASIIKNNNICCKILAITLHMLLLSMFSWMLAEGIHLYLKVITVFNTSSKRKLYYAIGWGSPIVTVGVAVGIGFDRYGVNKLCWLSVHSGFIWAFTGPALFVILVNFLVMILVLRVTANKSGIHPASRQFYSAKKIKSIVKATLILLPILGLTWIFGIFSMSNHTIAFSYIFVILNGLQVRHYLMRRVGFNSSTGSQSIALSTSNRKHPKIKISSNVEEFDVTEDQGSNSNLIYEGLYACFDDLIFLKLIRA